MPARRWWGATVALLALVSSSSPSGAATQVTDGSAAEGPTPVTEPAGPAEGPTPGAEPASAEGQSAAPDPNDRDAKAQAQELLSEGNGLMRRGGFVAALKRFRAAHELYPSPKILLNVGTALKHLGRNAEAATIYEQYLAHEDAEPALRPQVEGALQKVDQLVGRVTIALNVTDARIHVDGELLPLRGSGTTLRVDPGSHTVVADKTGWDTAIGQVTVVAGEHRSVRLDLQPAGGAVEDGSTQRIVAYSLGGVALAGASVGAVFGGLFLGSKGEADDHCDAQRCDPTGGEAVDRAESQGLVANVAFAAAAVAAAAGVVVYLTAPSGAELTPGTETALALTGRGVELRLRW